MISTAFPKRLLLIRLLFAIAMLGILVMSLLPVSHPDFSPNDKLNHLMAYGGLMMLGALGWSKHMVVAVGLVGFGVVIEGLQGMTSYRVFSVADMLANGAGVMLGWLIVKLGQGSRIIRRRSH